MEMEVEQSKPTFFTDEIWRNFITNFNKSRDSQFNTGEVVFEKSDIAIPFIEHPLHKVNEITTQGRCNLFIEFYGDGRTIISSDTGCTMKRVFWNRLNLNHTPRIDIQVLREGDEGADFYDVKRGELKLVLSDANYFIQYNVASTRTFPDTLSEEEIEVEKKKFYNDYTKWRYGESGEKFNKWNISGEGVLIGFINKRNEGQLIIYNRSFNEKKITTQDGNFVTIPPYHKYNASKNRCSLCGA